MDLTERGALEAPVARGGVFARDVTTPLGDARARCLALALAGGGRFA